MIIHGNWDYLNPFLEKSSWIWRLVYKTNLSTQFRYHVSRFTHQIDQLIEVIQSPTISKVNLLWFCIPSPLKKKKTPPNETIEKLGVGISTNWDHTMGVFKIPSGNLLHSYWTWPSRNSWFSHSTWWFSIVLLVINHWNSWFSHWKWWFSSSLCKRLPGRVMDGIMMHDDLCQVASLHGRCGWTQASPAAKKRENILQAQKETW